MKCPECQHDMIPAKKGYMCLNCGFAQATDPHSTPLIPGENLVSAPSATTATTATAAVAVTEAKETVSNEVTTNNEVTTAAPTEPVALNVTPLTEAPVNSLEDQVKLDLAAAIADVEAPKVELPQVDASPVEPAGLETSPIVAPESEIIKPKRKQKMTDKTVDSVAPRRRTKGTLDLKPTRDDSATGAAAVVAVDAISPVHAPTDKPAEVELPSPALPAPPDIERIAEIATPDHVIDHTAQAQADTLVQSEVPAVTVDNIPAVVPELPVVASAPAAPAIDASEPVKEAAELTESSVIEPPALASGPDTNDTAEALVEPPSNAETLVEPPVTPEAPHVEAIIPVAPAVPVPEAPTTTPIVASIAPSTDKLPEASPAPSKLPLIAKTHPEPKSGKTTMMIVGALVIVTCAVVAAYFITSSKPASKVGQKAALTQEQSAGNKGEDATPIQSPTPVATASTTPVAAASTAPIASASTRDAKRKTDLAAYAAVVKAAGANGFYPTNAPAISAQAIDPTTGKTYVISTTTVNSLGAIQYLAGGKCGAASVTPGKASTRYISLSTKLEGASVLYCMNVQ